MKFFVMNVIHVGNCWKNHLNNIHSKAMNDIHSSAKIMRGLKSLGDQESLFLYKMRGLLLFKIKSYSQFLCV